jgi:8-oxo-dGTP diphosphatase
LRLEFRGGTAGESGRVHPPQRFLLELTHGMPIPFSLTVKAVIFDSQNRCLLLRRSAANRRFVGCWEWPGGKLDPGEDFAVGLHREVREEAGLEIELVGLAGATQFEMPSAHAILLCLEARALGTGVRLSEEHDDSAWASLGDLSRYTFTPGVGEFMLDYAKRKGSTS